MTIQDLIDEVKQEIEARDLAYRHGANNRMRYKVYQKYYLMHYLRKHKLTLQEIGDLFGLKHCTVLYGAQQAEWLKKDRLFLKMTDDLRQKFEKYTALNYPLPTARDLIPIRACSSRPHWRSATRRVMRYWIYSCPNGLTLRKPLAGCAYSLPAD